MKILVIFVGHMRSFSMTKRHLHENLVQPLQADTALFTRPTVGFTVSDGIHRSQASGQSIREFSEAFNPVMVEMMPIKRIQCSFLSSSESRRWADERDMRMGIVGQGWWRSSIQSVLGMFELLSYASRRACQISSRYDMIIRCRPDLEFKSPVIPSEIYGIHQKGRCIGKPSFCNIGSGGGINDQFFAGRPEHVLPLMDIYKCLPKYSSQGVSIQPEVMLGHHLRALGLTGVDISADYIIRRGSGKKVDQRKAKD